MIICVDGPNFSGKTTLLDKFKLLDNVIVIDDNILNDYFKRTNDYFLARKKIQETYKFSEKNKIFIISRWIATLLVFDYYPDITFNKLEELIVPDYTIILNVKYEELIRRCKNRNGFVNRMEYHEQIKRYN